MNIRRDTDKTVYSCLICGHEYIEYMDGSTKGEPFAISDREIVTHEPVIENTYMGRRQGSVKKTHVGYICPGCGKLQIEV